MRRQMNAAALLGRLDQHYAARERNSLGLESGDCGQCGEGRVTVIGTPAAEKLAIANDGLPRAKPW